MVSGFDEPLSLYSAGCLMSIEVGLPCCCGEDSGEDIGLPLGSVIMSPGPFRNGFLMKGMVAEVVE